MYTKKQKRIMQVIGIITIASVLMGMVAPFLSLQATDTQVATQVVTQTELPTTQALNK